MRKKSWRGEVRLADAERDPRPSVARELADELGDHLPADALPAELGMSGEVEDVELVLVELVDHEADDPLAVSRRPCRCSCAGGGRGGTPPRTRGIRSWRARWPEPRACRGGSSSEYGRGPEPWGSGPCSSSLLPWNGRTDGDHPHSGAVVANSRPGTSAHRRERVQEGTPRPRESVAGDEAGRPSSPEARRILA